MRLRPTLCRPARRRSAPGFSLIELMIAMTIGLFISAALAAVFINSKSAFTSQDSLSQLQDNERLAMTLLTSSIEASGYATSPQLYTRATMLAGGTAAPSGAGNWSNGQGIIGVGVGDGTGTGEVLVTRYSALSTDSQTSCLGDPAPSSPTQFINVFNVSGNTLQCATSAVNPSTNSAITLASATTTAQPLVSSVQSFTVLYGIDPTNNGYVASWVAGSSVGTNWPSVVAARITIKFVNPYASQTGQPATISWTTTVSLMNGNS